MVELTPVGDAIEWVERRCAELGLVADSKGTLKTIPGSTHWHWRKPGCKGVLEVTYSPKANRLWAEVRANRVGDWTDAALKEIAKG